MTTDDACLQQLGLLIKPASADCNLRCEYCFYLPKLALYPKTTRHVMPRGVMHQLIGDYMQMAGETPSFGWQGGEPTTLGLDFFRRVVAVQAMKARAGQAIANGFQTNGILLDDDWARFFRRYRFLVGLSLDGPPHIHDHYRRDAGGKPTFERVLRAADILRRNEVEFNILCMVTAFSGDRAGEVWDFFVERDLRFLQFIPCIEVHPETGEVQPYSCTPEQYGRFLCEAFDRWSAEVPPQTYVRTFDDLLMMHMGGEAPTCVFRPTCAEYLLIEHNGDVYPCDFFVEREWLLGNIMETPLREIALSDRFREFRYAKQAYGEGCAECEWLAQCHGGCARHRLAVGPAAWRRNYFCDSYRMLFAHADGRLQEMARELSARAEHAPPHGTGQRAR